MDSDPTSRRYTEAYNKIHREHEAASVEDELALKMCIAQARVLLDDNSLPRYHRIKTLLLLTSVVGDYEEAMKFHMDASNLLRVARLQNPMGVDSRKDTAIDELNESLDDLRAVLKEESAEGLEDPGNNWVSFGRRRRIRRGSRRWMAPIKPRPKH